MPGRTELAAILAAFTVAAALSGCAGYRGGWASVPYIGETPPHQTELPESVRLFDLEQVKAPGM